MARKAIYKHATYVDPNTYPDDLSSPVGTTEWNLPPDAEGMFGNTPQTATITISSGVLTVTDSVTVAAAEAGTSDDLDKLAITNTNEYDLIYLFADTGDTITLKHTGSLSADGQIQTVSGADETLSVTKPTILIRKGTYWYGYGGGTVSDGSITTAKLADNSVTSAKIVDGAIVNADVNASAAIAQSKIASLTTDLGLKAPLADPTFTGTTTAAAVTVTGALTGALTGNADTATTATTVSDNAIGITQLAGIPRGKIIVGDASGDPALLTVGAEDTVLTVDANGDLGWEAPAGGGATPTHDYTIQASSYTGGAPSGTTRYVYIRTIDANNEGVFVKIKKNGQTEEVQIA